MIPVRLFLRNFMSYGEPGEELDFAFHTACLCGDNGNGKSALPDAMTWALWGRVPRLEGTQSKLEEIIRRAPGVNEALVELHFAVDHAHYRVLRRLRRGRGTTLELYLAEGDSWRPCSGATMSDTQRLIESLLGLDYHTFVMSSFLFQGKADSFTRATPMERKQVLGHILRLDLYDELAKRARDAAREREGRARQLGEEIGRLQAQAEQEEGLQQKATAADAALRDAQEAMTREALALEQAQLRKAAADGAAAELRRAQAALRQAQTQVEALARQAGEFKRRIEGHRAALGGEQQVRDAVARLQQARGEEEDLSARRERAAAVELSRQQAAAAIAAERAQLETALRQADTAAQEARDAASQAERLTRQAADLEQQIRACHEAASSLEACRHDLERLRAQQAADEQAGASVQSELSDAAARIAALSKAYARCPLCEQELGDDLRQRLLEHAQALASGKESSLAELARRSEEAAQTLAQVEAKMRSIEPHAERAHALHKQLGQTQQRHEEAIAAAAKADESTRRAQGLRAALESDSFAPQARRQLSEAQAALAEIAYDPARHKQVQQTIRSLAGSEQKLGALESAREALPQDEAHLEQLEKDLAGSQDSLASLEAECRQLQEKAADAAPAGAAVQEAQSRLADSAKTRDRLVAEGAALRAQIEACRSAAREAQARRRQRDAAENDRVIYGELGEAFGRQGVQALVIETVLPQLTADANELLGRMTQERMRVDFITQRERPDGGAAETLDVHIGDEMGTRRYELYSGGEAFRVDFAVRVALARLLAHRAGAKLQTLVIDEGFGTQDLQSRDRLVECINAIQGDFEKVLIITHIEELKDAFQERIEITKDETGSHIRRLARS